MLAKVGPASGPAFGGTGLIIGGANLGGGDDYRCRFLTFQRSAAAGGRVVYVAAAATVGAAFDAAKDSVRCTTPLLLRTGSANLTVTLNGQQYTATSLAYAVVGNLDNDEGVWRFAPYRARHVEGCNLSYTNFTEAREIAPSCVKDGVQGMRVRPAVGPTDGNTAALKS